MSNESHHRAGQPEWEPVSPEWEAVADIIMAHQRVPMYDDSRPFAQRCTGLGCDSLKGESDGPNSPRHAWHLADLIIEAGFTRERDHVAEADALRKQRQG